MQTLTRRSVGDAAAGLGLHFLHMSEGPFSHDAGQILMHIIWCIFIKQQYRGHRSIIIFVKRCFHVKLPVDLPGHMATFEYIDGYSSVLYIFTFFSTASRRPVYNVLGKVRNASTGKLLHIFLQY